MKVGNYTVSIVDFLVGVAILMILAAMSIPHFVEPVGKARPASPEARSAAVHPGR
jgi:Tfp pilus assembly protein FimT